MPQPTQIEIIAHRGFSAAAPENTMAALEAAVGAGVEAVEFDVQTAACGTPVLFHDTMLGRTTNGVGPLRRRPLAHLKALDAGSWFKPDFAGQTVPTQTEALEFLRGRVSRVYQDVKGYREMEDLDRMVEITRRAGMGESSVFVSSDWVVMNRLKQVAPEIRRGYLAVDAESLSEALDRAVVDEGSLLSVEVSLGLQNPEHMAEARSAGVGLVTWTVDTPELAAQAVELGLTRINTNQVSTLMGWRASLG